MCICVYYLKELHPIFSLRIFSRYFNVFVIMKSIFYITFDEKIHFIIDVSSDFNAMTSHLYTLKRTYKCN